MIQKLTISIGKQAYWMLCAMAAFPYVQWSAFVPRLQALQWRNSQKTAGAETGTAVVEYILIVGLISVPLSFIAMRGLGLIFQFLLEDFLNTYP